ARREVEGELRLRDLRLNVVDRGREGDLPSEPAAEARPQEREAGRAEVEHREPERGAEQPAEEGAPRHLTRFSDERPRRTLLARVPRADDRQDVDRHEAESEPRDGGGKSDYDPRSSTDLCDQVCCSPCLEIEEDSGLPRPDEVVAGAAEEHTEDDEDRPEHHEDREEDDRKLPPVRLHARVL